MTYAWGEWVGKGYQNEENFEICTFYIAKITNLGQQLGNQSIFPVNTQKWGSEICLRYAQFFGNLSLGMLIDVMLIKKHIGYTLFTSG